MNLKENQGYTGGFGCRLRFKNDVNTVLMHEILKK